MLSKELLTCIPQEHKSFWQFSRLDTLTLIPKRYSEPSQTSKMKFFEKIVDG